MKKQFLVLFLALGLSSVVFGAASAANRPTTTTKQLENCTFEQYIFSHFAPPMTLLPLLKESGVIAGRYEHEKHANALFIDKDYGIDRLLLAKRMEKCIEKFNLNCLKVAQKFFYGGKTRDDGIFLPRVIAKKINFVPITYLTLEEVKEITILIRETAYKDFQGNNIGRDTDDKKLVFFDTEERSFQKINPSKVECTTEFFVYYKHLMTPEALEFITQHLEFLEKAKKSDAFSDAVLEGGLNTSTRFDTDPYIQVLALIRDEFNMRKKLNDEERAARLENQASRTFYLKYRPAKFFP